MRLPRPRFTKKRAIGLVIICLLIVVAVLFIRQLGGPAVGTIDTPSQSLNNPTTQMIKFQGKYIAFDYQADLRQQDSSKSQPNVLEYYIFNKAADAQTKAAYLAVTVYSLPSANPQDNSGYNYRKAHPELYDSRTLAINNSNFVIFTKKDSREIIAFSTKGTKLAAISLSSALATSNELQNRFDAILNSWTWK